MENNNAKKIEVQTNNQSKQINFNIGCTIGSDYKATQIIELKRLGINHFQIMAEFKRNCDYVSPNEITILENCTVTIHMPFYFHYMLYPTNNNIRRFLNLQKYWEKRQKNTFVIAHCKGVSQKGKHEIITNLASHLRTYCRLCPNLFFLLENDVGSKTNSAPKLKDIVIAKDKIRCNHLNIGICLDTEHAYASGDELFSINYRENVSMVHLNAIPKFVEYGKHLDRHSLTELSKSKNGISFITKILGLIKPNTPIILERTDFEVVKKDIKLLKGMKNADIPDMDKKNMGKTFQKKRNIFF